MQELFVPKLSSYRIIDLVKAVKQDAKIKIIGIRPGEKIHEALLHDAEESVPTRCEGLMLARPRIADLALMTNTFDELEQSARARDTARTLALLHSLVPEFEGGGANTAAAAQ